MCSESIASRRHRLEDSSLVRRLLYVAFFLEVGLLLLVLPWSAFWEGITSPTISPALEPLLRNDFVRGGVSGLGVVNLFAGFADLIPVVSGGVRPESAHGAER